MERISPAATAEIDELAADLFLAEMEPEWVAIEGNLWYDEWLGGPHGDRKTALAIMHVVGQRMAHLIPRLRANRYLDRALCGRRGPFANGNLGRWCGRCTRSFPFNRIGDA